MGTTLSTEQLEDIEKRTHFNRKEIARMHKRFMAMDVDKKGFITVQQFALLPELCCNPLVDLIAASFDANKDNKIDFTEFLTSLDVFHPSTEPIDKLQAHTPARLLLHFRELKTWFQFCFRMFDSQKNGSISVEEVAALLATFVLPGMDATLTPIAQGVCSRYGSGDSLTFEQFTRFITKEDLESKLTIQF